MSEEPELSKVPEPEWVARLAKSRPDVVLMAPFMVYLVLLVLNSRVPANYMPVAIVIRGIGALAVVWLFRRHLPPMGESHWPLAIVVGVLVAAGWVAGQHLFNTAVEQAGLSGKWYIFKLREIDDPRVGLSAFSWRSQVLMRIAVASITVPIVEEIFWRGFLLRALINWDHFEKIPLGTFTWFSFLGTSLLSTLEHPDNWAVSILCWFAYNGLMYWKKSIGCLIITHGVTNLVLYLYVIAASDWLFW